MTPPESVLPITLDGLLKIWQIIGTPIVAAVAYYIRDISKQFRVMNGRFIKLESWTNAHEKIYDDRFNVTKRELDQIQREIHDRRPGQIGGSP